jgi:hypothetical protein
MLFGKKDEFLTKQLFLLQDNAWLHSVHVMTKVLADISGTPVEHALSSPDTVPSDFRHFQCLKMSYEDGNSALPLK